MGSHRKSKYKKAYKEYLDSYAVQIQCNYCNRNNECPFKANKQQEENDGNLTRCIHTPNRKTNQVPINKAAINGRVIALKDGQTWHEFQKQLFNKYKEVYNG